MWIINKDTGKWTLQNESLSKKNYDNLKQDIESVRLYSKVLSGSTFVPINSFNNIYNILDYKTASNWYINSTFSNGATPSTNPTPISTTSSYEYYNKQISEYGFTLKNMFTPIKLINNSVNNFYYVDLATTQEISDINATYPNLTIDGVFAINGQRILVKDQKSFTNLSSTVDPKTYFTGNYYQYQDNLTYITYYYYNNTNGIYKYSDNKLVREDDLNSYTQSHRYSVAVKGGKTLSDAQFSLSRLLNGYFPTVNDSNPIEFTQTHNYVLKNRVDYNNIYNENYNDLLIHLTQSVIIDTITYSIPPRTIAVGNFGVIINNQDGFSASNTSHIITNKYKDNINSIGQTNNYYWACADNGTLLRISKIDFSITRVDIGEINNLKSLSFLNDIKGVIVGGFNSIYITNDGGFKWEKIVFDVFDAYSYNTAYYYNQSTIYVGGDNGVFIEFNYSGSEWIAYKRKISKTLSAGDEYNLVEDINDIKYKEYLNWGLTYSTNGGTGIKATKEILLISTNNDNLIVYNINNFIPEFSFMYLSWTQSHSDIKNILIDKNTNNIFIGGDGVYKFSIDDFQTVGTISNVINATTASLNIYAGTSNRLSLYTDNSYLTLAGNSGVLKNINLSTTASTDLDPTFNNSINPRMLFLDYDIASKLNFFDNNNQYILPNQVSVTASYLMCENAYIYLHSISNENSWIDYYKDAEKTFTYYTSIDDTNAIKFSSTFSYVTSSSLNSFTFSSTDITNNTDIILNFAPNITSKGASRFISGTTSIVTTYASTYSTMMYKYLTIFRRPATDISSVGDILNISNDIIDCNLTINRIESITHSGALSYKYMYCYSDFNDSIINSFLNYTSSVTVSNINKYTSADELTNNFNKHTIGIGYIMSTASNYLLVNALLNNKTAYYNMQLDVNLSLSATLSTTVSNTGFQIALYPKLDIITQSSISATISGTYLFDLTGDGSGFLRINTLTSSYLSTNTIHYATPNYVLSGGATGIYGDATSSSTSMPTKVISYSIPYVLGTQSILWCGTPASSPETVTFEDIYGLTAHTSPVIILQTPELFSTTQSQYLIASITASVISTHQTYSVISFTRQHASTASISSTNIFDGYTMSWTNEALLVGPTTSDTISLTLSSGYHSVGVSTYYSNSNYATALGIYSDFNMVVYVPLGLTPTTTSDDYMLYTNNFMKFGYTPTYNILDYLENINSNKFTASKVQLAMPRYTSLPGNDGNSFDAATIYMDLNYATNKMIFGSSLKFEYDSIWLNTFVDVNLNIHTPPSAVMSTASSTGLLVMKKYVDTTTGGYVIEFNKKFSNISYGSGIAVSSIDILSRNTLGEISSDLQSLNNIQRSNKIKTIQSGHTITNLENESNFKIPTDSYAKILLSDNDYKTELTSILYVDYKNELSMNVVNVDKKFTIPIISTGTYSNLSNLRITCSEPHNLNNNDGVVLTFNGGTGSSQFINTTYTGYQTITVIDNYSFYTTKNFGILATVSDTGYVSFDKIDPFFNYEPVDILNVGIDKNVKTAIAVNPENYQLDGNNFNLINIDLNKYRYQLTDNLSINDINYKFTWLLDADVSDAVIGQDKNGLVWYSGRWNGGRWFNGTWYSGTWVSGDWYGGIWNSYKTKYVSLQPQIDKINITDTNSKWYDGRWFNGTWSGGTWYNGRRYAGDWYNGIWYNGIWNDGTWNDGTWEGGIWVTGQWNNGKFNSNNKPSYWINGNWYGGDFENGIWYNGIFNQTKNTKSRFGTNASNTRTALWHGGTWATGEFHSKLNLDINGVTQPSVNHKYSMFKTGNWLSGNWYGGIAININFNSSTWQSGIVDEIQVIGLNVINNSITLNGIFRFNINDDVYIIDNNVGNTFSALGSNTNPKSYKVANTTFTNDTTILTLNYDISTLSTFTPYTNVDNVETGLRLVSHFKDSNWVKGIWYNGVFDRGLFNSGIWYNGVFNGTWNL